MTSTPQGWVRDATPSAGTGSRPPRWAWTYRHGKPLLIASVVSVLLSGSWLVAALLLSGGGEGDPSRIIGRPSASPTAPAGPCEQGSWQAVEIEEDINTGILELTGIGDPPVFTYRDDGTGTIDFGERTTFTFHDRIFRDSSHQFLTGAVQFEYQIDSDADGDTLRHVYVNITEGARMIADPLPIPNVWYIPAADTFALECDAGTMTIDSEKYRAVLARVSH